MPDSRSRSRVNSALWSALALSVLACGRGDEVRVVEGVIDRETFIEVYVDLRAGAVRNPELALPEEERDRILSSHGVDEASLMAFVDAYGRELDFMNELWAEVERRVEELPPVPREEGGSGV